MKDQNWFHRIPDLSWPGSTYKNIAYTLFATLFLTSSEYAYSAKTNNLVVSIDSTLGDTPLVDHLQGGGPLGAHPSFAPDYSTVAGESVLETGFEEDSLCPPRQGDPNQWELEITPDPVWEDFFVTIDGDCDPRDLSIKIFDVDGWVKLEVPVMDRRRIELNTESLPPANYVLKLFYREQPLIRKRFLVIP